MITCVRIDVEERLRIAGFQLERQLLARIVVTVHGRDADHRSLGRRIFGHADPINRFNSQWNVVVFIQHVDKDLR